MSKPPFNPLPRYYELLSEAHAASEEQGNFDLRSEDRESQMKWNRLVRANQEAQKQLVKYVTVYQQDLMAEFDPWYVTTVKRVLRKVFRRV